MWQRVPESGEGSRPHGGQTSRLGGEVYVDVEQIRVIQKSEVDNGLKCKKRDSVDDTEFNKNVIT